MFVHHIAYTLKVLFFFAPHIEMRYFYDKQSKKKAKVSCFFFKMTIFWFKFEIIEGAQKK